MSSREREDIKNLFRGYKKVSRKMVETLSEFGLEVICCKNHYKLKRRDGIGGLVVIASTASDHRAGLNAVRYLTRLLEM